MADEKTGPAPTVALGEQPAAAEMVSGVGVPRPPGYMESSSHVRKITAEKGVAPPHRMKLSEE